ncbi:MAG: glycosyltransferase family 1 protein [Sulfitobacter sp.]
MANLLLNARFLMRAPTGVDRTATELIHALLNEGIPSGFEGVRALRPAGKIAARETRPQALLDITDASTSRYSGQIWEQTTLARARRDEYLLSLCNIGPVLRKRQVVMIHDAQAFRQPESYSTAFRIWYQNLQPRIAQKAAMVLTVSEFARRDLEAFGVVPAGKARVIHNGADHILRITPDPQTLARHGLTSRRYFLALGSLAPHKNLPMLVRAARMRKDKSVPLVIAGGGNARVFGDNGIEPSDDVRVLGRVSDAELRSLYNNATALVFPSQTEGFGLPPAEAMFCNCPVIASTGGAIPEVVGDAAVSLDPKDIEGWRDAMTQLADDKELRQSLSLAGQDQIAPFTWQSAARKLANCLKDLPT